MVSDKAIQFDPVNLTMLLLTITAIANEDKKLYGVQFHPEVDLTSNGKDMLKNFLTVAGFHFNYTMSSREDDCVEYIKQTAGNHKILVRLKNKNTCVYNNPTNPIF